LNGVRLPRDIDASLCHADLITLVHATSMCFAFRFCEPKMTLPAIGATSAAGGDTAATLPARMATTIVAEHALLDAKTVEVEKWCQQFERQYRRPPQHAEKLAGAPGYKALLRLKRDARRHIGLSQVGQEPALAVATASSSGDAAVVDGQAEVVTEDASPTTEFARQTMKVSSASSGELGLADGEEATDGFGVALDSSNAIKMPRDARWRFNTSPKEAVRRFLADGVLSAGPTGNDEWSEAGGKLAHWFLQEEGLSKTKVGEFLGGNEPLRRATLRAFVSLLELKRLNLVAALRYYLSLFKLPGEAQIIDRILEAFAGHWAASNADTLEATMLDSEVAYVLAYSTILLNTDLHNPQAPCAGVRSAGDGVGIGIHVTQGAANL